MSEPETKRTKFDVWRTRYSDARSQRWQKIMRRASRFSKMPNGQGFLEIDGQRSFRCACCEKFAEYADYESLNFFCQQHAEWYLRVHGMIPVFSGRVRVVEH